MVQNIIVLIIVLAVIAKVAYNTYKSLITKEKGLCGGCASCDLKRELKKRGKLHPVNPDKYFKVNKDEIHFAPKSH